MTTPYRNALNELKAAKDADLIAINTNKTYRQDDYRPRIKAAQSMVDMMTIDLTDISPLNALGQVLPFLEGATCANDLRDTGHVYRSGKYAGGLLFWIANILGSLNGHGADIICDDLSAAVKCFPDGRSHYELTYNHINGASVLLGFDDGNMEFEGDAKTTPLAIVIAVIRYKVATNG